MMPEWCARRDCGKLGVARVEINTRRAPEHVMLCRDHEIEAWRGRKKADTAMPVITKLRSLQPQPVARHRPQPSKLPARLKPTPTTATETPPASVEPPGQPTTSTSSTPSKEPTMTATGAATGLDEFELYQKQKRLPDGQVITSAYWWVKFDMHGNEYRKSTRKAVRHHAVIAARRIIAAVRDRVSSPDRGRVLSPITIQILDSERLKSCDRLAELAKANPGADSAYFKNLLGCTQSEWVYIRRRCVDEGRVFSRGRGQATRWFPAPATVTLPIINAEPIVAYRVVGAKTGQLITHTIALSKGHRIQLPLPAELTASELKRLHQAIDVLVLVSDG